MPELELNEKNINSYVKLIKNHKNKKVLEIGFGAGENLLNMIINDRKTFFIGCEPYLNGLANFLSKLDKKYFNAVKVFRQDARELLTFLPNDFLDEVFILFPDPWPKEIHKKRKIVNKDTIKVILKRLKVSGKIYLATDVEKYFLEMIELFNFFKNTTIINKEKYKLKPALIATTRYAQKAVLANKQPFFLVIKKNLD